MKKLSLLPSALLFALIAPLCAVRAGTAPEEEEACVADVEAFLFSCPGFTASWSFLSSSDLECQFCEFSGMGIVVDDATSLIVDSTTAPGALGCETFQRRTLVCAPNTPVVTFVFTCSKCIALSGYEPPG
jgi:hypothetical protein